MAKVAAETAIFAIIVALLETKLASSENSFLMAWARNLVPRKVAEIPEYFVYCGIFGTHHWEQRTAQGAKGEFLEVPLN